MKRFFAVCKTVQVIALMFLLAFSFNVAYAKAGCCSRHGGVTGCDSKTGHAMCKDGTPSPSCPCAGATSDTMKPLKNKHAIPLNMKAKSKASTTATPSATTPAAAATGAAASSSSTPAKTMKTKGCCARHGGIASCNKAAGFQMCKDGTQSTTCPC